MIRGWFSKSPVARESVTAGASAETVGPAMANEPNDTTIAADASGIQHAFLMLLWRPPADRDRRDAVRAAEAGQSRADLVARLIASAEFRMLLEAMNEGSTDRVRPRQELEHALQELGSDEAFIEEAYEIVLGRSADADGRAHYVSQLQWGKSRSQILTALFVSDEFKARYEALSPQTGFVPRDVQLCELANPAKWDNPDWRDLLVSLQVVPSDKLSMHRKGYEFTQLLFGLSKLDALRPDTRVLSVGAGHEPVLYWLANRVGKVIATDTYGGSWQQLGDMEGDERVFTDAGEFAPFAYRADRLLFLRMDGRALAFADNSFDVVYSLSSIEHFGGFEGARDCIDDMARILRPGGILALATEHCLAGPPHHEAFQPSQVRQLFEHPKLQLVQPIDDRVWDRYDYRAVDLRVNPHQTPHMVVTDLGSVFTSVMAFLRKIPRRDA
jgi:SAM-dependent methyltransferase